MSERRWFRSLYVRIALGFVALLAALLLAQTSLFLYLSGRLDNSPQGRTPQQLADFVARELSDALALNPDLDLAAHVRAEFSGIRRPFVVILHDGRFDLPVPGEGLATARVTSIYEGVDGHVWVGTQGGVSQFTDRTRRKAS